MDVRMPDGTIVKNVPDNITQEELLSRYEASKQGPSMGQQAGRQAGLTGRSLIQGALAVPDMLTAPMRALGNRLLPNDMQMQPAGQAAANMLGLPTPESGSERAAQSGVEALSGFGAPYLAAKMSSPSGPIGKGIQSLATMLPGQQAAGALGASQGSSLAEQLGAGQLGQTIAGVAGGVLPGARFRNVSPEMAQRGQAATRAQESGFVLPPSQVNPSVMNQTLEGISGKIKTGQVASTKNQERANNLTKQALGIPQDMPLNSDTLGQLRKAAGQNYEVIRTIGTIVPPKEFASKLDSITAPLRGISQQFPGSGSASRLQSVIQDIESLKVPQFTGDAALTQIDFVRGLADQAYRAGDKMTGKVYKQAADALEDAIEGYLKQAKAPADVVENFRNARQFIAKTYTVENAINPATGNVEASKLAGRLKAGKPLTGELRQIGESAAAFPKAFQAVDKVGSDLAISPLDVAGAGFGLAASGGNPLGAAALFARPAIRSTIMSGPYQSMLKAPQQSQASPLEQFLARSIGSQYGLLGE